MHSGVLLCSLLLEAFLRYKHQQRQSQGYLRFYRHTRDLLSLPFQVPASSSLQPTTPARPRQQLLHATFAGCATCVAQRACRAVYRILARLPLGALQHLC